MKNHLITAFFVVLSLSISPLANAEEPPEKGPELHMGGELLSRYYWRGLLLSESAVVQPYLELRWNGFFIGAVGSATIQAYTWQETDLYAGFSLGNFQFTIFDYYFYPEFDESFRFFDYRRDSTLHILEAVLEFTGTDRIPVRLLGGYNFYGADDANSLYLEAAYMFRAADMDLEIFAGYTPDTGYYHETRSGFTNVGLSAQRNLAPGKHFDVPLRIALVYSPLTKHAFLVAGIGLN